MPSKQSYRLLVFCSTYLLVYIYSFVCEIAIHLIANIYFTLSAAPSMKNKAGKGWMDRTNAALAIDF